jgi:hypothetical protein
MTDQEQKAYDWALHQEHRSVAADYARTLAKFIEKRLADPPALTEYHLRPEVGAFATLMEAELRKHDDRPGWKECKSEWLRDRLYEELDELVEALEIPLASIVAQEAADVANFAMMIVDVEGGLKTAPPTLQKPSPPRNVGDPAESGAVKDGEERKEMLEWIDWNKPTATTEGGCGCPECLKFSATYDKIKALILAEPNEGPSSSGRIPGCEPGEAGSIPAGPSK